MTLKKQVGRLTWKGMVLSVGEGAGILILEELESALKRGAPIIAEISGHGMSGDAFHITLPPEDGRGIIRTMELTLAEAGISPDQVDYINAHGTSTIPNDWIETAAIKKVFGDHARKVMISSTKSMTGHLLGAAGGLEAGISVLAIRDQVAPPTTNYENPDPACDLDYVPNEARKADIEYVAFKFIRLWRNQCRVAFQKVRRGIVPFSAIKYKIEKPDQVYGLARFLFLVTREA